MADLSLTPELLVSAYANGFFPMDVDGAIQWFSPDPRTIIHLDTFHAPRNVMQRYRNRHFEIRIDAGFDEVIRACADRPEGTWISDEIVAGYTALHRLGLAHSVECWREGELAGGLYGVTLGGAFFGESMFHHQTDASKIALVALVDRLKARGFTLLDIQFTTPHLRRFGAVEIPRDEYLDRLEQAVTLEVRFVD